MDPVRFHGTVTFLFTDIEGSTRLLQKLGKQYEEVLSVHHSILRDVIENYHGKEVETSGDGFFIIFDTAGNAVLAAKEMQTQITSQSWPGNTDVKIRIGIHTGEARKNETGFVGLDIHRAARIGAAGHGGQVLLSAQTKILTENDTSFDLSIKELGEFKLKDFDKPEKIFQLVIPGMESEFPPLKSAANKKDNLPSQLTKLIGREDDLKKIRDLLLQPEIRLITLTGPGGTGKTSLAYRVSESLLNDFANGVYVILLASISEKSLVIKAIAEALGLKEGHSKSLPEVLKEFLAEKEILLFMDNFEQVVSASEIIQEIMDYAPQVKFIVTSRIRLKLRSETEYFVPPLTLPEHKDFKSLDSLSQYSAVKLFIERARSVKPRFIITNENAPAIAEICVRLDGLPLAIELASARIKLFTPQMILSRLGNKLDILKSTSSALPERHQTLRQTVSWSYDLLSEQEKKFFRGMSVFIEGCSYEAIEYVFSKTGNTEEEIIDGIEALMDKSLLRRIDCDTEDPRFYMLETIREFSAELLTGEEQDQFKNFHAAYYLSLAETAEPNLVTKKMQHWLNRLELELHNFRTLLNWAVENKKSDIALRLGGSLMRFWIVRGSLVEGFEVMTRILNIPSENKFTSARAKVLNAAGTLTHEISNYTDAVPYLDESIEIYRKLNDENGIANVLNNISWVNVHLGNADYAKKLCEESIALNKKINNMRGIAVAMNNLAWLSIQQGEFELAKNYHTDSLKIRDELGDRRGAAFSKINLGWTDILLGNYDAAESIIEEGHETVIEIKDRQLTGWANCIKSFLLHAQGNYKEAEHCQNHSVKLMREIGNQWGVAFEITSLGHLKHHCGDLKGGKEFLEKAVGLFNRTGSTWGKYRSKLYLGLIYSDELNFDKAEELLKESLSHSVELKNQNGMMQCFEALGTIAVVKENFDRALKLFGCAKHLYKITKYAYPKCEKERLDKNIEIMRKFFKKDMLNDETVFDPEDCIKTALDQN